VFLGVGPHALSLVFSPILMNLHATLLRCSRKKEQLNIQELLFKSTENELKAT
jgi:hypothetical protein